MVKRIGTPVRMPTSGQTVNYLRSRDVDVELGGLSFPSATQSREAEGHEDVELGGQSFPSTTPSLEAEEHEDVVVSTPSRADP